MGIMSGRTVDTPEESLRECRKPSVIFLSHLFDIINIYIYNNIVFVEGHSKIYFNRIPLHFQFYQYLRVKLQMFLKLRGNNFNLELKKVLAQAMYLCSLFCF